MSALRRFRFTPLFYVGLLWLMIGVFNSKRTAFVILGVMFIVIGMKRADQEPPTDAAPPAPPHDA